MQRILIPRTRNEQGCFEVYGKWRIFFHGVRQTLVGEIFGELCDLSTSSERVLSIPLTSKKRLDSPFCRRWHEIGLELLVLVK